MAEIIKACKICGKQFVARGKSAAITKCCSPECMDRNKRKLISDWQKQNPERIAEYGREQRERERAQMTNYCLLCGKPLDEETRKRYHEKCVVDFALADMLVNPWCINKSLACKRAMNYGYTTDDLKELLIKRLKEINGGRTNGNELD